MVTSVTFAMHLTMNYSQMDIWMVLVVVAIVINAYALDVNTMEYIMNKEKLGLKAVKNTYADQSCQVPTIWYVLMYQRLTIGVQRHPHLPQ